MHKPCKDTEPQLAPLLPRVVRGDKMAVQECIQRYGGLVYQLAHRSLGVAGDVDDAVQEIFIEIWKQAGRFDSTISNETTFVAMLARRKLIDRYRRRKARPTEEPLFEMAQQKRVNPPDWEREDELAPVRHLLAQLPQEQRHILLMAVCENRTHQEISEETGVPLGTVKTHIRRGLLFVRERLLGVSHGETQ